MLSYLFIELCVGRITLNALIQRQTAQFFRLCQEQENQRIELNRDVKVSYERCPP